MTYEKFMTQYEDLIARYAADFAEDDYDEEDEAQQMAVDAVIDSLASEGVLIEFK